VVEVAAGWAVGSASSLLVLLHPASRTMASPRTTARLIAGTLA
jgi:hypothetical protein